MKDLSTLFSDPPTYPEPSITEQVVEVFSSSEEEDDESWIFG